MTRKELYVKIKELNVADAIKAKFGDNYTRVSNADLESFIKNFSKKSVKKATDCCKKKEVVKNPVNSSCKEAVIKLVSVLQAKRTLNAKEAEEIVALL